MKFKPENDPVPDIRDSSGRPVDIPAEGSLGLLALGAKGVKAWRLKRQEKHNANQHSSGK